MPKIKTKKTLLKRVKITKSGKILKKSIRMGHLKEKKTSNNKTRNSGLDQQNDSGHKKIFKQLLVKFGKNI